MTTPNVEELITYLQGLANEIEIPYPMEVIEEAAEVLQSQAERIAELERESETHSKAYGLAIVERDNLRHELKVAQEGWRCECSTDDACRFARERDALRAELGDLPEAQAEMLAEIKQLRAQLAAIAATEPVAWMFDEAKYHENDMRGRQWMPKISRHIPAVPWMQRNVVPLFTRPMPAQDVTELVDALEQMIACHDEPTCPAIDVARAALSKYKGAK